jgi:hypothetical protein
MKKILSLLVLFFFVASLSSCKKDYVCECSITDTAGNAQIITKEYNDVSKKDAKAACESFNVPGATMNWCKLK